MGLQEKPAPCTQLEQVIPLQALPSYDFNTYFNIIITPTLEFYNLCLSIRDPEKKNPSLISFLPHVSGAPPNSELFI